MTLLIIDVPLIQNTLNLLIFLGILFGVFVHHKRRLHVRTMLTCFVFDIALLLWVELRNQAIGTAMATASGTGARTGWDKTILVIHILFAISTLVWWVIQVVNGLKVYKGRYELLPKHAKHARVFLVVRAGLLVTAFFV